MAPSEDRSKDGKRGRHKQVAQHRLRRQNRREAEKAEIERLEQRIRQGAPEPGTNPLARAGAATGYVGARKFIEMPLSKETLAGLKQHKFTNMTAIQRATLPHAIAGRDVLGGAKTGSGKTLAFLVPVLEVLYRSEWSPSDGLGGLVVSPTRELALQIFDELRKVGQFHIFSAGLLIGGKDVKAEQEHIHGMNILISSPGRLLQHMDETPYFDCSQLKVLVLDEADRILDMGFSATLNAILANLPKERQTMLFSATLSKSVKDLARLSLQDPEYLSVHSEAQAATPHKLDQFYSVVELHEKMDVLHSFIKTHIHCKMIVFLSTCKQVQFLNEAFCSLRPGIPVKCLHGKMKQMKRLANFYEFCEAKHMVLFATDIAARGLDFPTVDWVIQADCPEDVQTYIHRVGRTARFTSAGKAFLLLLPSEEKGMIMELEGARVPLRKLTLNPKQQARSCKPALQTLLAREVTVKEAAQKAIVSYIRSIFLQPNKEIFDAHSLPITSYAESLGLHAAPRMRFLHVSSENHNSTPANGDVDEPAVPSELQPQRAAHSNPAESSDGGDKPCTRSIEAHCPIHLKNSDDSSEDEAGSDDGAFMVVKRQNHTLGAEGKRAQVEGPGDGSVQHLENISASAISSKKRKKLKVRMNASGGDRRVVFDEDGVAKAPLELVRDRDSAVDLQDTEALWDAVEDRFNAARETLKKRDKEDRLREKERLRATKLERKRKLKVQQAPDQGDEERITLLQYNTDNQEFGPQDYADSDSDDASVPFKRTKRAAAKSVEVAHVGMVYKAQSPASCQDVESMEAMALNLIQQRRAR